MLPPPPAHHSLTKAKAQWLAFTLLWLLPVAYTAIAGRAVSWLPATLRFLTVLEAGAKPRPKAFDGLYAQAQSSSVADAWVTLPWSDYSALAVGGVSALEKTLLASLRYPAGEQARGEAAKFIAKRYAVLYPQCSALASVRFLAATHVVGSPALAFPDGTWKSPPLELLQQANASAVRVLGTYPVGPAAVRSNPSTFVAQPEFDDVALEAMIGRSKAIDFDLAGSKVTPAGLALLAKHPGLIGVRLRGLPLRDADLAWLPTAPTLARLDLTGMGITDALIPTLAQLPKLQELRVAKTKLTAAAAPAIAAMHALVVLDVSGTALAPTTLMQMGTWPKLRMLYLGKLDMEKQPLRAAIGHGLISNLDLSESIPGRGGLDGLRLFPMLQTLNLTGAKMLDSDLGPLTSCRNLTTLDLTATGVSEKGVQALLATLPHLKSIRWGREGEKTSRAKKAAQPTTKKGVVGKSQSPLPSVNSPQTQTPPKRTLPPSGAASAVPVLPTPKPNP